MKEDTNQKFFLSGILIILGVIILIWLLRRKCDYCKNGCWKCKEGYSPYRRTGDCPPRSGWTYLDAYEQEDYYKKYPYIYPTPTNYWKEWYANRRANYRFLESLRGRMKEELLKTNPRYI